MAGTDMVGVACEVGSSEAGVRPGDSAPPEEQAANISAMAGTASQDNLQCSGLRNDFNGPNL
ncbi:MAG: hypothetical protein V3S68_01330 [Dehalococcoidia bacterium]